MYLVQRDEATVFVCGAFASVAKRDRNYAMQLLRSGATGLLHVDGAQTGSHAGRVRQQLSRRPAAALDSRHPARVAGCDARSLTVRCPVCPTDTLLRFTYSCTDTVHVHIGLWGKVGCTGKCPSWTGLGLYTDHCSLPANASDKT